MTVYDSYGVAKTRGLCKVGGKVSVTRGSLCQAADLDLIRDRDDDDIFFGTPCIMVKCMFVRLLVTKFNHFLVLHQVDV